MRTILTLTLLSVVFVLAVVGCEARFFSNGSDTADKSAKLDLLQSGDSASAPEAQALDADESNEQSDPAESPGLSRHGGPAPQYVSFDIEPEYTEYKTGETIVFRIKLTNEWDKELHIDNEPKLRVGPAMSESEQIEEIAVPALAGLTLAPGKSLNTTAEWRQHGKMGQYRVELGDVDLGIMRTSGGGQTFFVNNPAEQMRVQSIEGGGQLTLPNDRIDEKSVFVAKHVELTDHETSIEFEIRTEQMAPLGFNVSLIRDNDKANAERALGVEQSDQIGGVITGTITFNPTPIGTKRLKLVLSSWNVVHTGSGVETFDGPWSIELPLDFGVAEGM